MSPAAPAAANAPPCSDSIAEERLAATRHAAAPFVDVEADQRVDVGPAGIESLGGTWQLAVLPPTASGVEGRPDANLEIVGAGLLQAQVAFPAARARAALQAVAQVHLPAKWVAAAVRAATGSSCRRGRSLTLSRAGLWLSAITGISAGAGTVVVDAWCRIARDALTR